MTDFVKTNKNSGITLDEYNGGYSLVSSWENRDGEIKPNWCYRVERDGGEGRPGKIMPIKIYLGDAQSAIRVLEGLLDKLKGGDDNGVPF